MTSLVPQKTDVLIVGAGPTGLTAALSLHKAGCTDVTIVDTVLGGENTSRAIAIHAATLEALDEIGCADAIVAAGVKINSGKLWDGYSLHRLGDFSTLAPYTKFPFLLLVPQHITERVLGDQLKEKGISVIRPIKVTALKPNEENPESTDVTFEDGRVIQARYVVGTDGSHSTVRQSAGVGFHDPDGDNAIASDVTHAVLADVIFQTPPPDTVFGCLRNGNFFVCIPLPSAEYNGEHARRIAIGVPTGIPPHAPPIEYLQSLVDAYGPGKTQIHSEASQEPMKISKVIWSTRFRTHSAIADTLFTRLKTPDGAPGGVIVLAGDAAHIHSPIGGQGMNLGIRDAVFLGPVLAEHSKAAAITTSDRLALDKPLEEWAKARHERALDIIALTKRGLNVVTWKDETVWYAGVVPVNWARVRNWMLWAFDKAGITRKMAAWRLSGLGNR